MLDNDHRKLVWESMLGADYRARYFADLAAKYRKWESALTITVAVLTSSAFVVLLVEIPLAAKICTLVAAALSWLVHLKNFSSLVSARPEMCK